MSLAEGTSRGSISFWGKTLIFEALRPWGDPDVPHKMTVTLKNEAHCEESVTRHLTNMHGFAWCFKVPHILALFTRPVQDQKWSASQQYQDMYVASVMPCLSLASLWDNHNPDCLSLIFCTKEGTFLSLNLCDILLILRQRVLSWCKNPFLSTTLYWSISVGTIDITVCVKTSMANNELAFTHVYTYFCDYLKKA